ncbi:MAG: D-alanyl-D-alanine carboxypeptidase [Rhodobacteraceae bacterium]|nr:D-alanyl-D-alanine carboxypeptidase [Paracoccaceae bacterium]
MDARTGEVLYETNANTRLHPASLTKMMTLYIAFEAIERGEISLDTPVRISAHAAGQPPSKLGLRPGQTIALRYLIRAAAIKSANDAATAIGEAISGSEAAFAKRMNRTAKALGMTRTTFRNANGLTAEGHLSTAHDMSVLGRHLFYDYPQYFGLFSRRTADAGVATVSSTNRRFLDSYEGADGIKTGYTVPAGFNLTASAHRGNKHIIATILGGKSSASRNAKMAELLDLGFRKAPGRTTEQPPAAPVYMAETEDDAGGAVPETATAADPVAVAVASDVGEDLTGDGTGKGVAAGKTIRVTAAVAKSIFPRPRIVAPGPAPAADEVAVASLDDPTLRMAAVATPQAAATPAPAAAAEDPGALAAAVAEAAGEQAGPATVTFAVTPDPGDPAADAPVPDTDAAVLLALQEMPDDGAEAAVGEVAADTEATADEVVPAAASLALAQVAPPARPAALAPADAAPLAGDPTLSGIEDIPATAEDAPPGPADAAVLLATSAGPEAVAPPQPSPEEIVLADAAPVADVAQPLEVVTKVSTSGGRQWAISVGSYTSRYEAERVLLQTALIEMTTLDEALRKVVGRNGGYDALFVGMTQDMAELACARLAARAAECTVISPAG